jgi:hypothetical protein
MQGPAGGEVLRSVLGGGGVPVVMGVGVTDSGVADLLARASAGASSALFWDSSPQLQVRGGGGGGWGGGNRAGG